MLPERELERRLRAADPAAFLVPERVLRRVIKAHAHPPGIGLRVPHHKSYVLPGAELAEIVGPQEAGLPLGESWPAMVILLRRPKPDEFARMQPSELLRACSRLLFHARVHMKLDELRARGNLDPFEVEERIRRLGLTEFEEIEAVLRHENFLLPPDDSVTIYIEFAATFLELRHFDPALAADFFPSLVRPTEVEALLSEDVDVSGLLRITGLGDFDQAPSADSEIRNASLGETNPRAELLGARLIDDARYRLRIAAAERARARGNVVRASILHRQAAECATDDEAERARAEARADINQLVERLQPALELSDNQADQWRTALAALQPRVVRGFRTVEARLLYDLQKVCVDHERELYAANVVDWVLSLGKLAVNRPLPAHREVLRLRHLQSAFLRWPGIRVAEADRQALKFLLGHAVERMEDKLRERFRPLLAQALSEVDLRPDDVHEQVAHDKLIEELLDRVADRGFITISDLRDALSRNQLKLPDLSGPGEFLFGDKLILLNRRLPVLMDGVYRRGEIYRRWLQRLSSVAFGTRTGRFLTRYVALPFGGAFVAIEGLSHLLERVGMKTHLASAWNVAILGFFLLGVLQFPLFRNAMAWLAGWLGRGLHFAFIGVPTALVKLPAVQRFLASRPVQWFRKWLLLPLIVAGLTLAGSRLADPSQNVAIPLSAAVFASSFVLLNTRVGRDLTEAGLDWLARAWQRIRFSLLPNLFRFVMDMFAGVLDLMERLLYVIDEWFRFKSGESRLTFVVKLTLSPFWRLATYIVRFCITLLIEPQINPIKHFPVVTVSHKLILPFIKPLTDALEQTGAMDRAAAFGLATIVIGGIPGIFGFLVWELKENWRLYRANRPAEPEPAIVGAHGETVVRLLRRGFHSGTLPKLYARLRKARRKGRSRSARRAQEGLHHVEIEIRRFVERELLALLRQWSGWNALPITLGKVGLATNRIRIELRCPELPAESLWIYLDDRDNTLITWLDPPDWLDQLSNSRREGLTTALQIFFQLAGAQSVPQAGLVS